MRLHIFNIVQLGLNHQSNNAPQVVHHYELPIDYRQYHYRTHWISCYRLQYPISSLFETIWAEHLVMSVHEQPGWWRLVWSYHGNPCKMHCAFYSKRLLWIQTSSINHQDVAFNLFQLLFVWIASCLPHFLPHRALYIIFVCTIWDMLGYVSIQTSMYQWRRRCLKKNTTRWSFVWPPLGFIKNFDLSTGRNCWGEKLGVMGDGLPVDATQIVGVFIKIQYKDQPNKGVKHHGSKINM